MRFAWKKRRVYQGRRGFKAGYMELFCQLLRKTEDHGDVLVMGINNLYNGTIQKIIPYFDSKEIEARDY